VARYFYSDPAESSEEPPASKPVDPRPPAAPKGVNIVDARPLGQRIGDFSGHIKKWVPQTVMTGIFATGAVAVIGGTLSNYRWPDGIFQISDFGSFHLASRHLAKGILELAKCAHQIGRSLGKAMVNGILTVGNVIANHPMFVFKMAAVGTVGYLTFRQITLASIEENYTRKAYHLSLATLGAFATLWLTIA